MPVKPVTLPEWATDMGADIVEPSAGQKGDGWDVGDRPPAGWVNWLQNLSYQWFQYLDAPVGTGSAAAILGTGGSTSGPGLEGVGGAPNGVGLKGTGTGTGAGVFGTGGLTGNGGTFTGGVGGGAGVVGTGTAGSNGGTFAGQGAGKGVQGTGGATGVGVVGVGGATSGAGGTFTGTAGNANGVIGTGQGSAAGGAFTGGATGHGITGQAGASSGAAYGGSFTGGATVASSGVKGTGGAAGGYGVVGLGVLGYPGGSFTGGASAGAHGVVGTGGAGGGYGVTGQGTDIWAGGYFTGAGSGIGVEGTGGTTNAAGVRGTGGATNGIGVIGVGTGSGTGVTGTGGASAGALGGLFTGGSSNGNGVKGAGVGTGYGAYGLGIDGYGVIAESDTTSPLKAALRVVPQNADPSSSPAQGDTYVNSSSGKMSVYNGAAWDRHVSQVHSTGFTGETITNATAHPSFATSTYSIPANTLRVGSTIRVSAIVDIGTQSDGGTAVIDIILYDGTNTWQLALTNSTTPTSGYFACMQATAVVTNIGASGKISSMGYAVYGEQGSGSAAPAIRQKVNLSNSGAVLKTNVGITVTCSITWGTTGGGNAATLSMLHVDIT